MRLLQLFLLFLVGLFIRRIWLAATRRRPGPRPRNPGQGSGTEQKQDSANLTEQGISDADYEEIP
ncbi:hypothetical protein DRQ50_12215 [bacterium]|nr:MAG: hypothetical protein DRQ50_12215 [bacterium]